MKWEEVDKHKEHITRYCKKVKSFTSYENEDLNEFVVQIYTDLCGCDCENDDEFKKALAKCVKKYVDERLDEPVFVDKGKFENQDDIYNLATDTTYEVKTKRDYHREYTRKRNKKYYQENKEKIKEINKKYYQEHKKEIMKKKRKRYNEDEEYRKKHYEYVKKYVEENREHYNYLKNKWNKEHREQVRKAQREYYRRNREKILNNEERKAKHKEWLKKNKDKNKDRKKEIHKRYKERKLETVKNVYMAERFIIDQRRIIEILKAQGATKKDYKEINKAIYDKYIEIKEKYKIELDMPYLNPDVIATTDELKNFSPRAKIIITPVKGFKSAFKNTCYHFAANRDELYCEKYDINKRN